MALLQAAVIALVALIITPGFLFYFDVTPKLLVLLMGTALVLRVKPAPRLFTFLLLLDGVSLAVSTGLSRDPALSTFGTSWRRYGLVAQGALLLFTWTVAATAAGRPERVRTILRGISLAGLLTALYGIVQYFGWDPLLPKAAYHVGEGMWSIVRPPGTLGYVSYFATWLLMSAFLSMALSTLETSARWRRFAWTSAGLCLCAMVLTGTRAALVGLLAGIALWLYRSGWRINRRVVALAMIVSFAAAAFYFSPAGWKLRSRTRWFVEDPWGGARPALWRDSVRMAMERLPFGYGPEVFTAAFPKFESKTLARAYPDFSSESPHNIFLDALVSQGLPGIAILCGLCALAVGKRDRVPSWMAAAVVAGIVAQFFTVFTIPTALVFYVTIALIVSLSAAAPSPRKASRWRALAAAMAAIPLLYCAARFTVADRALAESQRAIASGDFATAGARFKQYQRWRLPGSSADLWYSRALLGFIQKTPNPALRLQVFPESAAAGLRATRTSEGPFDAWYNLSQLYAIENNAAGVESCLRQAIAANPNWFKPHWTLAQLLNLENRTEEAETEAATAADLNGGKHPEVLRTLREIRQRSALLQR